MARIVIPGGTGYLGRALASKLLHRGDDVVVLTRGRDRVEGGVRLVHWDAETVGDWIEHLDGADAIVHLNGRRVDTRATRGNIDELISSRVQPVRVIGHALSWCSAPPPVWVQSSSLAIFGDGGDAVIDESTTPSGIGPRKMVTVCLAWCRQTREESRYGSGRPGPSHVLPPQLHELDAVRRHACGVAVGRDACDRKSPCTDEPGTLRGGHAQGVERTEPRLTVYRPARNSSTFRPNGEGVDPEGELARYPVAASQPEA